MRQTIIDILSNVLGIEFEHVTDDQALAHLLARLRPHSVDGELSLFGDGKDGSYLLPMKVIPALDGVISPGVGHSVSFEASLRRLMKVKTVLVDSHGVDLSKDLPDSIHVEKLVAGVAQDPRKFITLEELLFEHFQQGRNLILQMDIEGAEYGVMLTAQKTLLERFLVIVVELHDINRWRKKGLFKDLYEPALNNLLSTHTPIHVHPNHSSGLFRFGGLKLPRVLELTLLRNDSSILQHEFSSIPHPLDIDFHSKGRLKINFEEITSLIDKLKNVT